MRKSWLSVVLLCAPALLAQAPVFVQSASPFSTAGASSGTVTISSFTSGHVGEIIASNGHSGSYVPTITGCAGTWEQVIVNPLYPAYNDVAVFINYGIGSGSCTATATYPGSVAFNLFFDEYSGMPADMVIDIAAGSPRGGSSGFNITTQGANELIQEIVNAGPGSSGCTAMGDSTYSNVRGSLLSSSASGLTTGVLETTGNAGIWSFSDTGVSCSVPTNFTAIMIGFRSTVPTLGRLQYTMFTTAGAQAFREATLAGDSLIVNCGDVSGAPTDSTGDIWLPFTGVLFTSDSSGFYNFWWDQSATAGTHTVTCPGGTNGSQQWEMTPSFIGGHSVFFSQTGTSSWSSGPVNCQSNCILFSGAAMISSSATFAASTGFAQTGYSGSAVIDVIYSYDKVVSGPGTGYQNTITMTGSGNFGQAFLIALEQSPLSVPFVRQRARGSSGAGPDGSNTAVLPSNCHAGDLVLACVANQAGYSPGAISDTQSDSYTPIVGGGANQYACWWARAASTASLSVTNTVSNCVAVVDLGVPGAPILDQVNQATSSSATSLSTGSITTTANSELLVSVGTDISSSFRLYFDSMSSGWSENGLVCGGHEAALWMGLQLQEPAATYSNLFTYDDAMQLSSSIFSFEFSEGGPVVLRGKTGLRGNIKVR